MDDLLDSVLALSAADLRFHNVQVEKVVEPHLPPVWVDGNQIRQVILNVINNAKQAMAEHEGTERKLTISMHRTPPDRVQIRLADTSPALLPTSSPRSRSLRDDEGEQWHGAPAQHLLRHHRRAWRVHRRREPAWARRRLHDRAADRRRGSGPRHARRLDLAPPPPSRRDRLVRGGAPWDSSRMTSSLDPSPPASAGRLAGKVALVTSSPASGSPMRNGFWPRARSWPSRTSWTRLRRGDNARPTARVLGVPTDVSDAASVRAMVEAAAERFARQFDVLVNNAAVFATLKPAALRRRSPRPSGTA